MKFRVLLPMVVVILEAAFANAFLTDYLHRNLSFLASQGEEASLSWLLHRVVAQMEACDLLVAVDSGAALRWPRVLHDLLVSPLTRQVVEVRKSQDFVRLLHATSTCRSNVILIQEPDTLLAFARRSYVSWDYDGRFVVVGLAKRQLINLTTSKSGRKTKHIVGLIQSRRSGEWEVLVNQLYYYLGTRKTTTWDGQRFTHQQPLFPEKLGNFQGSSLRAVVLEYNPAVFYQRDGSGAILDRYGLDMEVLHTIARFLNFSVQYLEVPPGELWGERLDNGSFNGMVGILAREEADVAVGNIYLSSFLGRLNFMSYSIAYTTDWSCFYARVEPPLPNYLAVVLPFRLVTWLSLWGGALLLLPVLHLVIAFGHSDEVKWGGVSDSCLYLSGLHFRVSQSRVPKKHSSRLMVAFMWLYVIIITTGYSSNLTAFLTVQRRPSSIETIRELYESKIPVVGLGEYFKYNMMQSVNKYVQGLAQNYKIVFSVEEQDALITQGMGVGIQGRKYLQYIIKKEYSPRGIPTVRILKECFMPHNLALGLQVHSPLKMQFDKVVSIVVESGLVNIWFQKSLSRSIKESSSEEGEGGSEDGHDSVVPLSLEHMQVVFFLLIVSFLAALCLLFFEILSDTTSLTR